MTARMYHQPNAVVIASFRRTKNSDVNSGAITAAATSTPMMLIAGTNTGRYT